MPLPFEEEPVNQVQKTTLKNVSSQKSVFDNVSKKPSREDFEKKVKGIDEKNMKYKIEAAELASQFNKSLFDKTLKSNKSVFSTEIERDLLGKMIQLAIDINSDADEQEGMGSLSWISLLLNNSLKQRDRINDLEYQIFQLDKKIKELFENKL